MLIPYYCPSRHEDVALTAIPLIVTNLIASRLIKFCINHYKYFGNSAIIFSQSWLHYAIGR